MFFDVSIAKEIWAAKYRFGGKDGLPGDADFDATAARVAAAAAGNESDIERPIWQARFEDAIARRPKDANILLTYAE